VRVLGLHLDHARRAGRGQIARRLANGFHRLHHELRLHHDGVRCDRGDGPKCRGWQGSTRESFHASHYHTGLTRRQVARMDKSLVPVHVHVSRARPHTRIPRPAAAEVHVGATPLYRNEQTVVDEHSSSEPRCSKTRGRHGRGSCRDSTAPEGSERRGRARARDTCTSYERRSSCSFAIP
jgi:hypothetical protein